MRSVVVIGIGSALAVEHEVGVLVWLGLRRFEVRSQRRQERALRLIVAISIEYRPLHGILQRHRALGPYDFGQFDREGVGHGDSRHFGVGFWDWRQALPDGARRAERKPPCEHCSDHGVTSHTASSSGNWMAEHHRRGTLDLV